MRYYDGTEIPDWLYNLLKVFGFDWYEAVVFIPIWVSVTSWFIYSYELYTAIFFSIISAVIMKVVQYPVAFIACLGFLGWAILAVWLFVGIVLYIFLGLWAALGVSIPAVWVIAQYFILKIWTE